MDGKDTGLFGIIIYEYGGEYCYHTVKAKNYECVKASMDNGSISFKAGRNNLNGEEINRHILKAQRIISKSIYGIDNNISEELKKF